MDEERHYYTNRDSEVAHLVKRARVGDLNAFDLIYESYVRLVYRYVFIQIGQHQDTEDIVQEAFFKAWKALRNYNGEKECTFRGWLMRIARNAMIDRMRRIQKENKRKSEIAIEDIRCAHYDSYTIELLDIIGNLPPKQREVITLKYVEGLSNEEVARILGKKEGAVRMLVTRGLKKLKMQLDMMDDGI